MSRSCTRLRSCLEKRSSSSHLHRLQQLQASACPCLSSMRPCSQACSDTWNTHTASTAVHAPAWIHASFGPKLLQTVLAILQRQLLLALPWALPWALLQLHLPKRAVQQTLQMPQASSMQEQMPNASAFSMEALVVPLRTPLLS